MPTIATPLLVFGPGPAALVTAKLVSGAGLPCLLAGHHNLDQLQPVELDERSLAILEPQGVLGVLRPYAASQNPFTIAPAMLENGLKHHCVADMLVTVYDHMTLTEVRNDGEQMCGKLRDDRSEWDVVADTMVDVTSWPTDLNRCIEESARFTEQLLAPLIAALGDNEDRGEPVPGT